MSKVTFPLTGHQYSDDGSTDRDMLDGGHTEYLLPMLQETVDTAQSAVDARASALESASQASDHAQATAQDAVVVAQDRQAAEAAAAAAHADAATVNIPLLTGNAGRMLGVAEDGASMVWADMSPYTQDADLADPDKGVKMVAHAVDDRDLADPEKGVSLVSHAVDDRVLVAQAGASLVGHKGLAAGSIVRTVADELNDGFANPKRFGAKGNGSADDSVAIQTAIDVLAAAGGGVIRFPNGNYFCNVVLKDGVHIVTGAEHFGYLAQVGGPIAGVTLSQAAPGFVVDTPTTLKRGVLSVKGINFQGLGAAYAGGGVRFQGTRWGAIKCCMANGFADQAFLHSSGFGVVFEDLLAVNCLLNTTRTGVNGVLETHGTDDFLHRCEIAGQSPAGVTDANMYRAAVAVFGANNFLSMVIGEQGDRGIYIGPQSGEGHRMSLCRADSNGGTGFWIDGNIIASVCSAYNNSLAGSGLYSGFYASATSSGCKFSACRSDGHDATIQQKYGYEDYVNNSTANVRNSYVDCGGFYNALGLYLTQGFLGSGVIAAPLAIRPADGTTPIDVTGTSLVVLSGYTTATNVTNFTGGAEGETIRVLGDAQVTIVNGSGIITPSGANVVLSDKTMYSFTQYNGAWYMG
ncbi:glycosyl hydrolase family 28-related protein [Paraburkholderia aromaticivorans]|uniref:glycosyl hydrolase family 28-related protein n=1 Tax=Paraburkholderia aromaticivorans TaxID=2026199 RepID=UPI0014560290|nr:glycosyl hydrolase family 28-related protein [Paraburkholderia aromaticivorans]